MPNTTISGLSVMTAAASGDLIPIVDISDTWMASTGTTKRVTQGVLLADRLPLAGGTMTGQLILSTATESKLRLVNTSASTWDVNSGASGNFHITDVTASQNRVTIDSSGRVGIGGNPDASHKFKITGSARLTGNLYFPNNSGLLFANSSAVDKDAFYADGSNNIVVGNTGFAWTSIGFYFNSATAKVLINSAGNVGIGIAAPNANAILDVTSTTKAFLPPRMTTTQKNAISSPTSGMVVYDSTLQKLSLYGASAWETVTSV